MPFHVVLEQLTPPWGRARLRWEWSIEHPIAGTGLLRVSRAMEELAWN